MWKFLSPFTCWTMRDFSSRSAGRGQCQRGVRGGTPQDGQSVLTVANDPSQGLPLEVKLHVHVLALREGAGVRAGERCGGCSSAPHVHIPVPCHPSGPSGSVRPQWGPAPLPAGRDSTAPVPRPLTNREELSLRMVLAFPKAVAGGWGYGVVRGGRAEPWARGRVRGAGRLPSSTGLDCRSCSFTLSTSSPLLHTAAT